MVQKIGWKFFWKLCDRADWKGVGKEDLGIFKPQADAWGYRMGLRGDGGCFGDGGSDTRYRQRVFFQVDGEVD